MIATTRPHLIEKLAEIRDLSPGVRFGELLANLAFLVEDRTDRTIREVEDDRLMDVMESHLRDLERRRTENRGGADAGGLVTMGFDAFVLRILKIDLCFAGVSLVLAAFDREPRLRRRTIVIGLGAGITASVIFGAWIHHVYRLDERLFIAAADGDAATVEALLKAGACPDATWEDGTPALAAARRAGHARVVAILRRAGAVEPPNVLGKD